MPLQVRGGESKGMGVAVDAAFTWWSLASLLRPPSNCGLSKGWGEAGNGGETCCCQRVSKPRWATTVLPAPATPTSQAKCHHPVGAHLEETLARGGIPLDDGAVLGAREDELSVFRHGNARHWELVPL